MYIVLRALKIRPNQCEFHLLFLLEFARLCHVRFYDNVMVGWLGNYRFSA